MVVLTVLVALLTMHGLTSDHAMGMPGLRGTADPHREMTSSGPTAAASQLQGSAITSSMATTEQQGHSGGMCVAVLGIGLLLWLRVRTRRRQLHVVSFASTCGLRSIQARAAPLLPRLRPSLVTLGISRT